MEQGQAFMMNVGDAIMKMWISKLEHLTGLDQSISQVDYDIVCRLARSA